MNVRIDEAGNHRSTLEIDGAGRGPGKFLNVGRGAEGHDSAVADGDRLAYGRLIVDGHDLSIDHDRVGALCREHSPDQSPGAESDEEDFVHRDLHLLEVRK